MGIEPTTFSLKVSRSARKESKVNYDINKIYKSLQ